ncbi:MAG: hypothetical protein H6Q13_3304 [Bacteroidetes bacterium]|jgi:hypothetical protein|nr:hypothetical protein [Bacteroidota bacterium]
MKKTTIYKKWGVIAAALLTVLAPSTMKAQDKVEVSMGADVVSGYIWRGQDLGGVSIQPSISIGKNGFSLTGWGSVGLESTDTKEFDLTLGYSTGGFSIALTDYWFNSDENKYFNYSAHSTKHVFETTIGYDFGPLAFVWNTNIAGADGVKANGDRAYSSYFEVSAPFKLGDTDCSAELGATPWENDFYGASGFAVTNIGFKVSKEIKITDSFSIPAFAKTTWNPCSEKAYFTFGVSF